jgi:tetratricopeptide (TPR) repeat protein
MFERAGSAAAAAGDRLAVAKAAGNMAQVHHDRGDPFLAREGFAALADASRAAADTVALGRALINLAMLDIRLGDPLPAIARLEEARQLARASADEEAEENALGQLASAFAMVGQPQRALATLDTALALARAHGQRRQMAEDLKLLGDLYAEAGNHRSALDHYAQAQVVNAELELLEESANVSIAEAASYRMLGHADTALARAHRALELHERGGYRRAQIDDHVLTAELLAATGVPSVLARTRAASRCANASRSSPLAASSSAVRTWSSICARR